MAPIVMKKLHLYLFVAKNEPTINNGTGTYFLYIPSGDFRLGLATAPIFSQSPISWLHMNFSILKVKY